MAAKNEAPYADFGQRLMSLRTTAQMTRQQLGEICGVAPSTIVNYERGTRIPYADTAVKMAQAFNLTVEELLGFSNPEAEMAKAEALDTMRSVNGSRGEARLRYHLNAASSALAGGELDEEQMQEFALEMTKMAMLAQQKLREIHTNKRYQDTVEAKAGETAEAVQAIDNAITGLNEE